VLCGGRPTAWRPLRHPPILPPAPAEQSRGHQPATRDHHAHTPTLGEADTALGPELADGLDPWVRDLTVARFPTTCHWLNQQELERVNDASSQFVG